LKRGERKISTAGWSPEKREAILGDLVAAGENPNMLAICRKHRIVMEQLLKLIYREKHIAAHNHITADRKAMLAKILPIAWTGLETGLNRLIEKDKLGAKLTKEARATLIAGGHLTGEAVGGKDHQPMFQIQGGATVTVNVIRTKELEETDESVHLAIPARTVGDDRGTSGDDAGAGETDRGILVQQE